MGEKLPPMQPPSIENQKQVIEDGKISESNFNRKKFSSRSFKIARWE